MTAMPDSTCIVSHSSPWGFTPGLMWCSLLCRPCHSWVYDFNLTFENAACSSLCAGFAFSRRLEWAAWCILQVSGSKRARGPHLPHFRLLSLEKPTKTKSLDTEPCASLNVSTCRPPPRSRLTAKLQTPADSSIPNPRGRRCGGFRWRPAASDQGALGPRNPKPGRAIRSSNFLLGAK